VQFKSVLNQLNLPHESNNILNLLAEQTVYRGSTKITTSVQLNWSDF